VSPDQLYLANVETIEGAIRFVCRRHRLGAPDAEEFAATVRLKLIDDDYAVLRKFQHRSSLRTFLIPVVSRFCLDYRNGQWGKWRPSAEAKRLGGVAVMLEKLLVRDGLTFDEAAEVLRTNHHVCVSETEMEELRRRLPRRALRRFAPEEVLENVAAPASFDAESGLNREERESFGRAVAAALETAVGRLEPEERLLVRLRFYDGLKVAEIARLQQVDQKSLYRRIERILGGLRATLRASGLDDGAVAGALREGGLGCD
jgi:RNA polymerase sigma factor for flagellar operon FliA